jgi:gluconate kinase
MGMDFIMNKEGENEGGTVNTERKISAQWKGMGGILSRVTCSKCKRMYRDLLVRKRWAGKNLVV